MTDVLVVLQPVLCFLSFFVSFLSVLFIFEKERESASGEGRERDRGSAAGFVLTITSPMRSLGSLAVRS